jgi:hypothetical protein
VVAAGLLAKSCCRCAASCNMAGLVHLSLHVSKGRAKRKGTPVGLCRHSFHTLLHCNQEFKVLHFCTVTLHRHTQAGLPAVKIDIHKGSSMAASHEPGAQWIAGETLCWVPACQGCQRTKTMPAHASPHLLSLYSHQWPSGIPHDHVLTVQDCNYPGRPAPGVAYSYG